MVETPSTRPEVNHVRADRLPATGQTVKVREFELPTSQEGIRLFIERANRTGSGLKSDPFHRASTFVSDKPFQVSKITGKDGIIYDRIIQDAIVNQKSGVFEYIINKNGEITHQLFRFN